jgi:hypothetical protein
MVLQTAQILNYQMIPNTDNIVVVDMPSMEPINNVAYVKELEFL